VKVRIDKQAKAKKRLANAAGQEYGQFQKWIFARRAKINGLDFQPGAAKNTQRP